MARFSLTFSGPNRLPAALLWLLAACILLSLACDSGIPHRYQQQFHLPALHAEPDPVEGGRIVDALGREVLLRGVNVNAYVEYWAYDPGLFTTYPFTALDADAIAGVGWNVVRLLLSWSRVEPEPGVYDEAYLDEIAQAVGWLEERGVYTILDLHQDAWGPALAARPDEVCRPGWERAFGWDGAPAWATLHGGAARCIQSGIREVSPAVMAAFDALWSDAPGPGGVGIRTRYVRMLGHVVRRFAQRDAIAGYDVMNEPNAFDIFFPEQIDSLVALYREALAEIRAAEAAVGAPPRLVLLEPGILWADFGLGVLPPFDHDDQIVYSPHIYQGGINPLPLDAAVFERARDEAALLGGAPVLSGEWGGDPGRAEDPDNDYFERHQALQDEFRFGATLWTWREACGDPHKAGDVRAGRVPFVWGLFDVDCETNTIRGPRAALFAALSRPALRAAPGRLSRLAVDPETGELDAAGEAARPYSALVVYLPQSHGRRPRVDASGLRSLHLRRAPGAGHYLIAWSRGGAWTLHVR